MHLGGYFQQRHKVYELCGQGLIDPVPVPVGSSSLDWGFQNLAGCMCGC